MIDQSFRLILTTADNKFTFVRESALLKKRACSKLRARDDGIVTAYV